KEVVGMINENAITRTSGFNGDQLIEATDVPPGMFGGGANSRVVLNGPGSMSSFSAGPSTPESDAAARKARALLNKQEFARLTLGLFAASFSAYPLEFTADASPADGKSIVVLVKGDGDFAARLYLDRDTHLPSMM